MSLSDPVQKMMVVPHSSSELLIPEKRWQEAANAAASPFEWREGVFSSIFELLLALEDFPDRSEEHISPLAGNSQVLKSSFAGGQQIFYTHVLQLLLQQSQLHSPLTGG